MMGQETDTHLQMNMFSGELDDTRTRRQKQLDRERQQPRQIEMFSQRDVAQFGVNAHPLLPLSPNTKLGLIFEDPRTGEQIEQDRQRAAQERTHQLFVEPAAGDQAETVLDTKTLALVPYEAPCLAVAVIETTCRAVIPFAEARRYEKLLDQQPAPAPQAA